MGGTVLAEQLMPYKIVTDSNADLVPGYAADHDILEMELTYTLAGKTYRCNDPALSRPDFYSRMRAGEMPLTAQINLEEAKELQEKHGGFIKTMWCGEEACELKMKDVAGMSSRCIPFHQEHLGDVCPICGKPAKKMIYWGVAY